MYKIENLPRVLEEGMVSVTDMKGKTHVYQLEAGDSLQVCCNNGLRAKSLLYIPKKVIKFHPKYFDTNREKEYEGGKYSSYGAMLLAASSHVNLMQKKGITVRLTAVIEREEDER